MYSRHRNSYAKLRLSLRFRSAVIRVVKKTEKILIIPNWSYVKYPFEDCDPVLGTA